MPEISELKIMTDYINHNVRNKLFTKSFHVEKGNNPVEFKLIDNFYIEANSFGKEIKIKLYHDVSFFDISVFMGMSGNWKWVPTENWNDTRFVRMRLDSNDGYSLLLYGSYMGPKYKIGGFKGVKRGPDPTKQFEDFKNNILQNLDKKVFDKPICEAILNQEYFNGIGAYLTSEIIGRLDINPFSKIKDMNGKELNELFNMILYCCNESYKFGGGELLDWKNPFGYSKIDEWIMFYNNKETCYKEKFGTRNIWIHKKWKNNLC
jgi:endonuclease VIII-like 1